MTEAIAKNRTSHFVHDFAGIDLPLLDVVGAIDAAATPAAISEFVVHAWDDEHRVLQAARHRPHDDRDPFVEVALGARRTRRDAVIVPLTWRTRNDPWIPPIDADLEFAAFGPQRTHVHLYGCSQLPPGAVAGTQDASLAQRLTVAVVRHVLDLLTARILSVAAHPALRTRST